MTREPTKGDAVVVRRGTVEGMIVEVRLPHRRYRYLVATVDGNVLPYTADELIFS